MKHPTTLTQAEPSTTTERVSVSRRPPWRARVLRSTGVLTLGKVAGDAVAFALFVLISRKFGPEGIGAYSFAMGLTGIVAVLSELGTDLFTIREVARTPDDFASRFGAILSLRLALTVVAGAVLVTMLPLLPFSAEVRLVVALIGGYQLAYALLLGLGAAFIALDRPAIAAAIDGASRGLGALAAIGVATLGAGLGGTLVALPVVSGLGVVVTYGVLRRKLGGPRLGWSISRLLKIGREVVPYGVGGIVSKLQQRLDVTLLGFLAGTAAAGAYNVAYRPVFMLWILPHFFAVALLPVASHLYSRSMDDLQRLFERTLSLAILVAVPASAGLALLASDIVALVFGSAFGESVVLLRLLSWLFLLACVRFVLGAFLTACGRQAQRARAQTWTLVAAALLYLTLIPTLGALGAAIAALTAEGLLTVLFATYSRSLLGWPRVGRSLWVSSLGAALFVSLFGFVVDWPLPGVIAGSIAIYAGALALIPRVWAEDLRPWLASAWPISP